MVHFKLHLQESTCGLRLSKTQFVSLLQPFDTDFPIHSLLVFTIVYIGLFCCHSIPNLGQWNCSSHDLRTSTCSNPADHTVGRFRVALLTATDSNQLVTMLGRACICTYLHQNGRVLQHVAAMWCLALVEIRFRPSAASSPPLASLP